MTEKNQVIKLRPFGRLLNLIEVNGYEVEHQYDDLVFIDNTAFLFRFDKNNPELVHLHFNIECEPQAKEKLATSLLNSSKAENVKLVLSNDFELKKADGKEEIQLIFQ